MYDLNIRIKYIGITHVLTHV